MRTIAYLRVSTDKQENDNQRFGIEKFCFEKNLHITEYIEETISGSAKIKDRKLNWLLPSLMKGDVIVFSEISRISRKIFMTFGILQQCLERGIKIYTVKEGYCLGEDIQSKVMASMWGLSAEMERTLLSQRIKESLDRKVKQGVILGRPPGRKSDHKLLDNKLEEIISLLDKKSSISKIAEILGCHRHTVSSFIKSNNLR